MKFLNRSVQALIDAALAAFSLPVATLQAALDAMTMGDRIAARTALRLNKIHRLIGTHFSYTALTGSGSGNGSAAGLTYYLLINSTVTGKLRGTYASSTSFNPFSAKEDQIDWSQDWVFRFRANMKMGTASTTKITLHIGGPNGPTTHTMATGYKGASVFWSGTGSACTVSVGLCDGSAAPTTSSTASHTANNTSFIDYALEWKASTGLTLKADGSTVCTLTTTRPSGLGTSGSTGPVFLVEGVAVATDVKMHLADAEIIRES